MSVCASIRVCTNKARYDSGLCGVCDVVDNYGEGVRLSDKADEPTKPHWVAMDAWSGQSPISDLQRQLLAWQDANFGETTLLRCLAGMTEELGELAHAVLKRDQLIRGMGDNDAFLEAACDALADLRVYGTQLASALGICEETNFRLTARNVMNRDWRANPATGESDPADDTRDASIVACRDGQGDERAHTCKEPDAGCLARCKELRP